MHESVKLNAIGPNQLLLEYTTRNVFVYSKIRDIHRNHFVRHEFYAMPRHLHGIVSHVNSIKIGTLFV